MFWLNEKIYTSSNGNSWSATFIYKRSVLKGVFLHILVSINRSFKEDDAAISMIKMPVCFLKSLAVLYYNK